MALINSSLFALMRTRKQLEKAYQARCWHEVRHWDIALTEVMNHAFDDQQRDTPALVAELNKVLKLYGNIVAELPDTAVPLLSPPQAR